jgi:hypothetical protein
MRDGIWKDLPMSSSWRTLVRRCEREADRSEPAVQAAERALELDARQELSSAFLRQLTALAHRSSEMLPNIGSFEHVATARDIGGTGSPLEESVLNSARRLEATGLRGGALVQQALEQSIALRSGARIRQIEEHCVVKAGSQARPIVQAARRAVAAIEHSSMVRRILSGEGPMKLPRPSVNADEDLTRPR